MNKNTTKVELFDINKLTLKTIEQAMYQATKRVREGTAILPEQQDKQEAEQVVTKLLDACTETVTWKQNGEFCEELATLTNVYLFTLAQATSAMVSLFVDPTSDMED